MPTKIPRYVVGEGDVHMELAIVREHSASNAPAAYLAVSASSRYDAFVRALRWSQDYSHRYEEQYHPPEETWFYPRVKVGKGDYTQQRLVKKIGQNFVWTENRSHGSWLHVEAIRE